MVLQKNLRMNIQEESIILNSINNFSVIRGKKKKEKKQKAKSKIILLRIGSYNYEVDKLNYEMRIFCFLFAKYVQTHRNYLYKLLDI